MTPSRARSIVSVSVLARKTFWARRILTASSRKCLCETRFLAVRIGLPIQKTLASYEHKWKSYEHGLRETRLSISESEGGLSLRMEYPPHRVRLPCFAYCIVAPG